MITHRNDLKIVTDPETGTVTNTRHLPGRRERNDHMLTRQQHRKTGRAPKTIDFHDPHRKESEGGARDLWDARNFQSIKGDSMGRPDSLVEHLRIRDKSDRVNEWKMQHAVPENFSTAYKGGFTLNPISVSGVKQNPFAPGALDRAQPVIDPMKVQAHKVSGALINMEPLSRAHLDGQQKQQQAGTALFRNVHSGTLNADDAIPTGVQHLPIDTAGAGGNIGNLFSHSGDPLQRGANHPLYDTYPQQRIGVSGGVGSFDDNMTRALTGPNRFQVQLAAKDLAAANVGLQSSNVLQGHIHATIRGYDATLTDAHLRHTLSAKNAQFQAMPEVKETRGQVTHFADQFRFPTMGEDAAQTQAHLRNNIMASQGHFQNMAEIKANSGKTKHFTSNYTTPTPGKEHILDMAHFRNNVMAQQGHILNTGEIKANIASARRRIVGTYGQAVPGEEAMQQQALLRNHTLAAQGRILNTGEIKAKNNTVSHFAHAYNKIVPGKAHTLDQAHFRDTVQTQIAQTQRNPDVQRDPHTQWRQLGKRQIMGADATLRNAHFRNTVTPHSVRSLAVESESKQPEKRFLTDFTRRPVGSANFVEPTGAMFLQRQTFNTGKQEREAESLAANQPSRSLVGLQYMQKHAHKAPFVTAAPAQHDPRIAHTQADPSRTPGLRNEHALVAFRKQHKDTRGDQQMQAKQRLTDLKRKADSMITTDNRIAILGMHHIAHGKAPVIQNMRTERGATTIVAADAAYTEAQKLNKRRRIDAVQNPGGDVGTHGHQKLAFDLLKAAHVRDTMRVATTQRVNIN